MEDPAWCFDSFQESIHKGMGFVHSLVEAVTTDQIECGLLIIVECRQSDENHYKKLLQGKFYTINV